MEILEALRRFAPPFSTRVWESALWLMIGAILAPGKRTVSAVLRVLGMSEAPHYQTYHRVLNRAVWSRLAASAAMAANAVDCGRQQSFVLPKAAWYQKSLPTFADALALVRQHLWQIRTFQTSRLDTVMIEVPRALFNAWSDLLCYAA
ncbi:MAG: transposase [Phormidesmis sp.]